MYDVCSDYRICITESYKVLFFYFFSIKCFSVYFLVIKWPSLCIREESFQYHKINKYRERWTNGCSYFRWIPFDMYLRDWFIRSSDEPCILYESFINFCKTINNGHMVRLEVKIGVYDKVIWLIRLRRERRGRVGRIRMDVKSTLGK